MRRDPCLSTIIFLVAICVSMVDSYNIGIAIADVTGPPVEIAFMGYGKMEQKGSGIHLRQFSRTFIIDDAGQRLAFVSVDCSMIPHALRKEVVDRLQKMYGNTYTVDNMLITATHTHSTPGGFLQHMLFDLSTLGFVRQTFEALASGIVESVKLAHERMQEGRIYVTEGELLDTNINRSPTAYENNPAEERARYKHNVDKTMTQMKFVSTDGRPLGVISWFAVHPTSMNNTNTLISIDNVGYASILFETKMNPESLLGKGPFVAAFSSSNLGDVSPNTRGPKCQLTGATCDMQTSACANKDQCVASGPGVDMFDSTSIIANQLMDKAWSLWNSEADEVSGPIRVVHQFVDMPLKEAIYTNPNNGTTSTVRGCLPAMGYSFGAGTTDGPGAFSFTQGTKTPNALWNAIRDFLAEPTAEDIACHGAKPILLATGQMDFPFEWQPRIVSTQLAMIGNVAVAAVPGEFTTMAGRRLRSSVLKALTESGAPTSTRVVVAGLVNTYSDYIVTPEEYQVQRYEGASTIFGPYTLTLYLEQYSELAKNLMKNETPEKGPEPPEFMNDLVSLTTPVIFDSPRWQHGFGDCLQQPPEEVKSGQIVSARFVSANPRNNLMHNATYLTVERRVGQSNQWTVVATDANWETKFHWMRTSIMLGNSEVMIQWTVPANAALGEYRIRNFGHYKYIFGGIFNYQGTSRTFKVVASLARNTRFRPRD